MTDLFIALAILSAGACSSAPSGTEKPSAQDDKKDIRISETVVKPGIEVLRENGFAELKGKRVGLITNPTGIDNSLVSTIDILAKAPEVNLVALFAPEHGVRGDHVAGEKVANSVDPATGVPVYSLHGKTRKPTADMLKDIDVLVYDIQDIGCRSYTFISTMGLAMQAASENGKEFMVLDRPDPLGGYKVEGNLVEKGMESFVGQFPIPYIYGLTPGELASYLHNQGLAGSPESKLTVIKMKGWKRSMSFADTGMPWVLPSPQIPYPATSILYPTTGIMGELDYVSIGVGYTLPFGLTAAPWIDAQALTDRLTALDIPGVEFRPIHFKPYFGKFNGSNIGGVQVYVTDPAKATLTLVQFYIMQELAAMYPDHKAFDKADPQRVKMFDMVCGSTKPRELFSRNYRVEDMAGYWNDGAEQFQKKTIPYYLYE